MLTQNDREILRNNAVSTAKKTQSKAVNTPAKKTSHSKAASAQPKKVVETTTTNSLSNGGIALFIVLIIIALMGIVLFKLSGAELPSSIKNTTNEVAAEEIPEEVDTEYLEGTLKYEVYENSNFKVKVKPESNLIKIDFKEFDDLLTLDTGNQVFFKNIDEENEYMRKVQDALAANPGSTVKDGIENLSAKNWFKGLSITSYSIRNNTVALYVTEIPEQFELIGLSDYWKSTVFKFTSEYSVRTETVEVTPEEVTTSDEVQS